MFSWPGGRRTKWLMLGLWLAILAPAFLLAGRLGGAQQNDVSTWLAKNSDSARFVERSQQFTTGGAQPAIVVYERPGGLTDGDVRKAEADMAAFQQVSGVSGTVQRPLRSDDNRALTTTVPVVVGKSGWTGIAAVIDHLTAISRDGTPGLRTYVTGPAGYSADSGRIFGSGGLPMKISGVIVILVLLLTYRSPLLWILPVACAGVSVVVSEGIIYLLVRHAGVVINAQTSFILGVLVFGAATDYALLLISRYREELRRCDDRHEAMAVALRRAAPAIVASAGVVAVSLATLMLATLNSTRGLGPVCAVGVLVALVAMLTLLPALLTISGRWVFWPVRPEYGSSQATRRSLWLGLGERIGRRPRVVWLGTALALGVLATGLVGMHATGIPSRYQYTKTTQAVYGEQALARHFPVGSSEPLLIVTRAATADRVRLALSVLPDISTVVRLDGNARDAFIMATPRSIPGSPAALRTAAEVRGVVRGIPGSDAVVGGAAITLDLQNGAARDNKVVIPVILGVIVLLLALLLRSLVAPLLLVATVVLSFAAALGLSVLLFGHVLGFHGMNAALPLQAFTFLVALGVDYNIFLITRVREESAKLGNRRGAIAGLAATGTVITSAGLVLAGTFGALASLPVIFLAELGFTVAIGVLLDTFIVRSVLVVALAMDTDHWFWWPARISFSRPAPVGQNLSYIPSNVQSAERDRQMATNVKER